MLRENTEPEGRAAQVERKKKKKTLNPTDLTTTYPI